MCDNQPRNKKPTTSCTVSESLQKEVPQQRKGHNSFSPGVLYFMREHFLPQCPDYSFDIATGKSEECFEAELLPTR